MDCPNCQRQNPADAEECAFCSANFGALSDRGSAGSEIQPEDFNTGEEVALKKSSPANFLWIVVGLVLLGFGAWVVHQKQAAAEAKARAKARASEIQRDLQNNSRKAAPGRRVGTRSAGGVTLEGSFTDIGKAMAGNVRDARSAKKTLEKLRQSDRGQAELIR